MDTRTGQLVDLSGADLEAARAQYDAWLAGFLKEKPRYIPVEKDHIPFDSLTAKQRKRLKIKSYKDFCR
jgi:hypothetical protein